MRLSSKVTWGLAWTGLAVVLAVPSADFLTGTFGNKATVITSTTEPVKTGTQTAPTAVTKTAAVTTTKTKTGVIITPAGGTGPTSSDPVNKYLKTNKGLPDYISDGTTSASTAATQPKSSDQVQVASVDTTAPTPFPSRPAGLIGPVKPKTIAKPAETTDSIVTSSLPKSTAKTTTADPVVIVDEPTQQAALDTPDHPVPPAPIVDEAATWRAKGLSRYLKQNGLLDEGKSSASVTVVERPSPSYDPDGFYLSDGPNQSRAERRARILRMLQESDQSDDEGTSFTLF